MKIKDLFVRKRVKVYMKEGGILTKGSTQSSGYDLRNASGIPIKIGTGETKLIPTGVYLAMPDGVEAQVRPRSGLALKEGLTVLNTPGTVDADYRGEISVIMINHSNFIRTINPNDRIAQLVFAKVEPVDIHKISDLPTSLRGTGGFGSSGKN